MFLKKLDKGLPRPIAQQLERAQPTKIVQDGESSANGREFIDWRERQHKRLSLFIRCAPEIPLSDTVTMAEVVERSKAERKYSI